MNEFNTLTEVATHIDSLLKENTIKKRILVLYAFNATGKTRITNLLYYPEEENIKVLCYNAFIEDLFTWNNEDYFLNFNPNSWIIKLIVEQGLEDQISINFKNLISTNIEPLFDFQQGTVSFNIATGDEESVNNIKITRSEESMLVWSIFYTVLETAIEALNTEESNRTTPIFNYLETIIIDDPVSSIDDTKIISMALKLIELIEQYNCNSLKFLITTHHPLFYNIIVNRFRKFHTKKCNFSSLSLSKSYRTYILEPQDDAPFAYHLLIKNLISDAIATDTLQKFHFNLFRNLLEKTANFLGYNHYNDCLNKEKQLEFNKLLNQYSHSRLSELETSLLSEQEKTIIKDEFTTFVQRYNFK